ncbi:hypothetical protein [Gynurincola endophyticus]|uniref:hypothetical protein n=1 Tax=Gynurincola endophyticus TaxID=2479004 RepID=UPI000F8EA49F|nr:hypothetical protein [Gynurincola endophyticus]
MVSGQQFTDATSQSIHEKLFKILNAEKDDVLKDGDINFNMALISGVSIRTTPSMYTITIEITCKQSRHLIVRLLNAEGKIERMFGWYVIKGANITTLSETTQLSIGTYRLDIIDNDGFVIYNTQLQKSS